MTKTDKQIIEEFREKFPKIEVANYGQLPGSGATWKMGIIGKYSVKGQVEDFILEATAKTRAATIEEVRKSFVHIAIGGKDTRDELKGLELYTKTLKMLDKLKTEQGEDK